MSRVRCKSKVFALFAAATCILASISGHAGSIGGDVNMRTIIGNVNIPKNQSDGITEVCASFVGLEITVSGTVTIIEFGTPEVCERVGSTDTRSGDADEVNAATQPHVTPPSGRIPRTSFYDSNRGSYP